jgi:CBS domain-containing protein
VYETLVLMVEKRYSALPVVDHRECCVGMISASDVVGLTHELVEELSDPTRVSEVLQQWLVSKLTASGSGHRRVSELMTSSVVSIGPEVPIQQAAYKMLHNRIHHLPVVDEQQRLLGVVSTMDILSNLVDTEIAGSSE